MTRPIITVEGLSKRYRIGARERPAETFREAVAQTLRSPFAYLRQMARPPTDEETLWSLREVSFEVAQGEVLGIIGQNGAGKSTLLKILARITEPTLGRARLSGRVGSLLEVGSGFHPELTGRENTYLNGVILGMRRQEVSRKLDEIVAFAEVEKFLDTPVKRYSSGMYVRLAFAVAAHLEPEILIVDEVLAVGDASFQRKCLGKMGEVAKEGRTVLFVSHNMANLTRLCNRALLLERGTLVADGAIELIIGQYMNRHSGGGEVRRWDDLERAPGTEAVRLTDVSLLDDQDQPALVANVEQRLRIRLGYHVLQPGAKFRCNVSVFTREVCAFSTMQQTETVHGAPGRYEAVVEIPPNFLAEADYRLTVSMFTARSVKFRHVYVEDALVFHVYDPITGRSARGDYTENYSGVVRPLLPWRTTYLGPAASDEAHGTEQARYETTSV